MVKQQKAQRIPVGAIAGIAAVAVAAGGGAAWWHWHSANQVTQPSDSGTTQVTPPSTVPPQAQQKVTIYWLKDTGNRLEPVPQTIATATQQPDETLETAFESLLAGPKDGTASTTIPEGTKLLGLQMKPDGIHVNLSQEFTTGGGSAAMTGRVAQVLYTATTLEPSAKVWIEVEGKPMEILGGEGLELQQPLTRQSFQENFTL